MNDASRNKSVLVVEDDADLREHLKEVLKTQGFRVFVGGNVEEGKAQFRIRNPDLILTDLRLPGGDGNELIYLVRETDPERPIIAMSGGYSNAAVNLEMADVLGANTVLCKPFRNKQLLDAVQALIGAP